MFYLIYYKLIIPHILRALNYGNPIYFNDLKDQKKMQHSSVQHLLYNFAIKIPRNIHKDIIRKITKEIDKWNAFIYSLVDPNT